MDPTRFRNILFTLAGGAGIVFAAGPSFAAPIRYVADGASGEYCGLGYGIDVSAVVAVSLLF